MSSNYVTIKKTVVIEEKVTKAELRVRVAKDVLKWLKNDELKVSTGEYVTPENVKFPSVGDAQQHVDKLKQCTVCALGSCFIGLVNQMDKLDLQELFQIRMYSNTSGPIFEDKMRNYLREIFSETQMLLIESAFEMQDMRGSNYHDVNISAVNIARAIEFGKQHDHTIDANAKSRLKAIMNNIVKNKGIFIP